MFLFSSLHSIYAVFFLTGFTVGFGHCIGMCGPIAVSVSLSSGGENKWIPHLLYNGGRTLTYTILGGVMGFFGSFTRFAVSIVMIQKGVLLVTGIMVMTMGFAMMGLLPGIRIFSDDAGAGKIITRGFKYLSTRRSYAAYLPMGMLLGLLPCGPVYTALVAAARAGMEAKTSISGAVTGMGALFCFGVGTAPALLLLGKLAQMGLLKWRRPVYRLGAALMIGMGGYFVYRVLR